MVSFNPSTSGICRNSPQPWVRLCDRRCKDFLTNRVASSAVETFLDLFEPTFQEALPNLANTLIRDWINADLLSSLRQGVPQCSTTVTWPTSREDFRDLLLAPAEARALGGTGNQPYGNLVHQGYDLLMGLISEFDKLNQLLIRPWTTSQSGVAGTLSLSEQDLIVVDQSILDLSIAKLQVKYLDTIQHEPLALLKPTRESNVIVNKLQFGNESLHADQNISSEAHPLTFSFGTHFRLGNSLFVCVI